MYCQDVFYGVTVNCDAFKALNIAMGATEDLVASWKLSDADAIIQDDALKNSLAMGILPGSFEAPPKDITDLKDDFFENGNSVLFEGNEPKDESGAVLKYDNTAPGVIV